MRTKYPDALFAFRGNMVINNWKKDDLCLVSLIKPGLDYGYAKNKYFILL